MLQTVITTHYSQRNHTITVGCKRRKLGYHRRFGTRDIGQMSTCSHALRSSPCALLRRAVGNRLRRRRSHTAVAYGRSENSFTTLPFVAARFHAAANSRSPCWCRRLFAWRCTEELLRQDRPFFDSFQQVQRTHDDRPGTESAGGRRSSPFWRQSFSLI